VRISFRLVTSAATSRFMESHHAFSTAHCDHEPPLYLSLVPAFTLSSGRGRGEGEFNLMLHSLPIASEPVRNNFGQPTPRNYTRSLRSPSPLPSPQGEGTSLLRRRFNGEVPRFFSAHWDQEPLLRCSRRGDEADRGRCSYLSASLPRRLRPGSWRGPSLFLARIGTRNPRGWKPRSLAARDGSLHVEACFPVCCMPLPVRAAAGLKSPVRGPARFQAILPRANAKGFPTVGVPAAPCLGRSRLIS